MMTQSLLCLPGTTSVFLSLKSSDQLPIKIMESGGGAGHLPYRAGRALAKIHGGLRARFPHPLAHTHPTGPAFSVPGGRMKILTAIGVALLPVG